MFFNATGNQVTIHFVTDSSGRKDGFAILYSTGNIKCKLTITTWSWSTYLGFHQEISGDSGEIMSPNYPAPYPMHSEYYWTLTVPDGYRVLLRFNVFDVGSHCLTLTTFLLVCLFVFDPQLDSYYGDYLFINGVQYRIDDGDILEAGVYSTDNTMKVELVNYGMYPTTSSGFHATFEKGHSKTKSFFFPLLTFWLSVSVALEDVPTTTIDTTTKNWVTKNDPTFVDILWKTCLYQI